MRILIVEDEVKMANLLSRGLQEEGIAVDIAGSGEDAVWMATATDYDAVLLDVMLPGIDGFETCRQLRKEQVRSPILMLTARDAIEDRVTGLDGGADDYLAKPFSFVELLARLRALMRRGSIDLPVVLENGDLRLNPATHEAWRGEQQLELSAKEFAMLEAFMRHSGKALTRFYLLEHLWSNEYENRSNIVDVYVGYLRQKIDKPFGTEALETVRGVGYRLKKCS